SWYGNTAEGFAELKKRMVEAAGQIDRDPAEIACSTSVLVELDPEAVKRPHADDDIPPVPLDALSGHVAALADAGADEAILILRPIDEESIRAVGAAL